jgi:hypothetical protein
MRVVAQEPGVVAVGEGRERGQWGEVAVHAENAFGQQEAMTEFGSPPGEQGFECRHVVVRELKHRRATQPRAGKQAGMRKRVDKNEIRFAREERDDSDVGEIAAAEDDGILAGFERSQRAFERGVA